MRQLGLLQNPNQDDKVIDACSIFGMMDTTGVQFSGEGIIKAIALMHMRSNGLGGGFAVYGLYPEHADEYAFHIMYTSTQGRKETEAFLKTYFNINYYEEIPTRKTAAIISPPAVWRYFLEVKRNRNGATSEDDFVVTRVMEINTTIADSFVFSSGKNMGVFKGAGYPEDIADYFCLEQYQGYLWTAHGRFPTNTPGWWGGAHPFSILDWTVVHNGEISSYGINQRYLEQFGYKCTMQTDTEVIAYALDLLIRRHGLPINMVAKVLAAPLWSEIGRCSAGEERLLRTLRQIYGSLLLNGPFAVIIANSNQMIGLTDRIKLRPLTAASKDNKLFISSEESAIRLVSPELDRVWNPCGGEPIVGSLGCPVQETLRETVEA